MTDRNDRVRVGDRITIYARGAKKIYVADFWENNVHRKVSLKTPNKKVAIERATKLAADLHQGTYRPVSAAFPVQQAVTDYILVLQTDGRARKTIVKYAGVFKIFLAFLAGRRVTNLSQVTASHFDAWRAERRAVRHAKTVYSESVIVKQLFKWSKSRKLLLDDPLNGIRLNKPTWDPKAGPTLEQVDQILAVADRPLRDWLSVLAFTGMRVGELQRLRREDVDFAGNWIHIRSHPGAETKTKASRKVPIHARLRAVLEQVPASGHVWFFTAGPSPKYPTGGNPINAKKVNDRLAQVLARLSLPAGRETGFVVHSLRHTFETVTINAGIPQRVIDTWLGHNADRSMAAVYYRLGDADSQRFMQAVPFGGTTTGTTQTPDGVGTNE